MAAFFTWGEHQELAGHARNTRNGADHVGNRLRQETAKQIGRAALSDDDVVADLLHALAGRILDAARYGEERERATDCDSDAENRQEAAHRAAAQITNRESDKIHCGSLNF